MSTLKTNALLILSALLLLSLWSPGTLLAANEPALSLKATNREATVIIEVKGQHLSDLYAYQFSLAYDSKLVRFTGATSPIAGFTVEPIVKDGRILFAHSKVGSAKGTSGEAALASFTFERIAGSAAKFVLHEIKLVDSALKMVELGKSISLSNLGATFKDVAGHWAEKSIMRAVEQGWVAGYSDQTYRPHKHVTRAEFVAMLARALQLPIASAPELEFADRDTIPAWARGYIAAAVEARLIAGYADGTFQAGKLITRAEMAALIVRSQGIVPASGDKPGFSDSGDIPQWALPYIAEASGRGWIKGVGDNRFAPLNHANRAEAAHLLVTIHQD